jgi:Zn-dependent peptidase ImmA (M78 family)
MLTLLYKKISKYDKKKSVFLYVNQILNKNVCVFLTKTINKNKNDFSYVSKIQKIDFCFLAFVDCP